MKYEELQRNMQKMAALKRIAETMRSTAPEIRGPDERSRERKPGENVPTVQQSMTLGGPIYDLKLPSTIVCDRMERDAAERLSTRLTMAYIDIAKAFEDDIAEIYQQSFKPKEGDG